MELKATVLGKRMAQHPYDRVELLHAGVKVSGDRHEYLIPFNQLTAIHCRRGLVWGELEFVLPDNKVVRLHGTEWAETQRFHYHLHTRWQQWSNEMSAIAAELLQQQLTMISRVSAEGKWLSRQAVSELRQKLLHSLQALPVPVGRLESFDNCRALWQQCQDWLRDNEASRLQHNQVFTESMLAQYSAFFASIESSPLNAAQARAVINGERSLLVLAGAGSGKTSVLVARAGWLLTRGEAAPEQILMLAFGRKAAEEMDERLRNRLNTDAISARTFHALALYIIQQGSKKVPAVSKLENDTVARQALLTECWQQQCHEKKAQAKGWRQWLEEDMAWEVPEGEYWHDPTILRRIGSRLDRWVSLMRMHGGSQADMIASVPDEVRELFGKRVKLLAPLLKAWKTALKDENAVDFYGLIHQAINVLEKGRFISPWKHIMVDEFQDISPLRAALLVALRKQNTQTSLFAVGDDWQSVYRFSGAHLALTTAFTHYFGEGDSYALDTTYRFNSRISEMTSRFIQQNPHQLSKPLKGLSPGDKKAVMLLPDDQLDALLDKLSGYATPEQRILILARYHHLKPTALEKAATRWPNLQIDFLTIHASKGQQADYAIVLGLQEGQDSFPAPERESIMEEALLPPPEDFPDAEERRLLYVAMTRARHRVWLLYSKDAPSVFVDNLKYLEVPTARKP